MAQAASFPFLKEGDRRTLARDLTQLTAPHGSPNPDAFSLDLLDDLDAAAAYFARIGIPVTRVETA